MINDPNDKRKLRRKNCRALVDLFLELERNAHSNEKSVAALPTDTFVVDNTQWLGNNNYLQSILENCSNITSECTSRCGDLLSLRGKEVHRAKEYIVGYEEYWRMLGDQLELSEFQTHMRVLFQSKPDRSLNNIAEMMLLVKRSKNSSTTGNNWSAFINQYSGSTVVSKVDKLRDEMLKFKPQFSYDQVSMTLSSEPFLDEPDWTRLKLCLDRNAEDQIFAARDMRKIRIKLKHSSRIKAAKYILILWLYSVVLHDDFFYGENFAPSHIHGELLSMAFTQMVQAKTRTISQYHMDLDRSNLELPYNSFSIALLSLLQIFVDDIWTTNKGFDLFDSYNNVLQAAQKELITINCKTMITLANNDKLGKSDDHDNDINFEEYLALLLEEIMLFYFSDLQDPSAKIGFKVFDLEIEETVLKLLCIVLLPLTMRRAWNTAILLVEKISTIYQGRSFEITKQKLFRFCTVLGVDSDLETAFKNGHIHSSSGACFTIPTARVLSPINFAVKDSQVEFLKSFYSLFPESRMECDAVLAGLGRLKNGMVENSDLSFILSDCGLDEIGNGANEMTRDNMHQFLVNEDTRSYFLMMAKKIDEFNVAYQSDRCSGDKFLATSGHDLTSSPYRASSSYYGFCENSRSEIVLCDGQALVISEFTRHIKNYLYALPSPLPPHGHHSGFSFLHAAYDDNIPSFIRELIISWASRNHVRLRYLMCDSEGNTPLHCAIKCGNLTAGLDMIKSVTSNAHFPDASSDGYLSHSSAYKDIDLHTLFVDTAISNSFIARANLGTISKCPSTEEMLTVSLQRSFSSMRSSWSLIMKTDFSQLFTVMYSKQSSNLDSVIQAKLIMSYLGIPVSRVGATGMKSPTAGIHSTDDLDTMFLDPSPSSLYSYISFQKATEIKKAVRRWIANRLHNPADTLDEASLLCFQRADVSILSMGLLGSENTKENKMGSWEVNYESLMALGRFNCQILSKQIAAETRTISHYPRYEVENVANTANLFTRSSCDSSDDAGTLQHTLKLAYLLLEFFRQLSRARLLLSMTDTNVCDGVFSNQRHQSTTSEHQHPLDQRVNDARNAAIYEREVKSIVLTLTKACKYSSSGKVRAKGILSEIPFFHSVQIDEFCEAFHLIVRDSQHDGEISEIYEVIRSAILSLLRLLGKYAVSEALVALKRVDDTQNYVQTKHPEKIYSSLFSILKSTTVQDIIEIASSRNAEHEVAAPLVACIVESADFLLKWTSIPNFFSTSSPKFTLHDDQVVKMSSPSVSSRHLYTIQCLGSAIIYVAALIPLRDFYLKNDIQSTIQNRGVNPLCTLCDIDSSPIDEETEMCQHLLKIGMKTIQPDGKGMVALIIAALHGKSNILALIYQYISTSSAFEWKLSNGKVCSFADAYFERNSSFRYLVWNVLMICPHDDGENTTTATTRSFQKCLVSMIKKTNRFSFPCDSPPNACFTCLELAALKQLPDVLFVLCQQLDSYSIGAKASASATKHISNNNRTDLPGLAGCNIRRIFFYMLVSERVPISALKLFTRNAYKGNDIDIPFTYKELWPSSLELSKTIRIHLDFKTKANFFNVTSVDESEHEAKLTDSFKQNFVAARQSYFCKLLCQKVIASNTSESSNDIWNPLYIAISTRDTERINLILQMLLGNETRQSESSFALPPLLFHFAAYYNRMHALEKILTENATEVLKRIDLRSHSLEYFDPMQIVCAPMDVAVKVSNISSVRTLISIDATTVSWSNFLYASISGSADIALVLLDSLQVSMSEDDMKHSLNSTSLQLPTAPHKTTVLTCICRRGVESPSLLSLVSRILSLGANAKIVDDHGVTCLDYSIGLGCKSLAKLILEWNLATLSNLDPKEKIKIDRGIAKLASLVRSFLLKRGSTIRST